MATEPDPRLRVSDQERSTTIEQLRVHLADGRLTMDEFGERVEKAYGARTWADLRAVTDDLPDAAMQGAPSTPPVPTASYPPGPSSPNPAVALRRLRVRRRLASFIMPNAICISIWAMTGHGGFWPEWVLFGTGISLLGWIVRGDRDDRRSPGPGPGGASNADQDRLGRVWPPPDGRFFATVAFVDIVGSTSWALALGDRQWADVLQEFLSRADEAMRDLGGHCVFRKGDEVVAAFDAPATTVHWVRAARDAALSLGLQIRAGVHAGELEQHSGHTSGVALHIGQRVSGAAQPGEVLVTSTVAELVVGSRIELVDRGEHQLRGLAQPWHLFALGPS